MDEAGKFLMNRRAAVKTVAGGAVASVVWAEPTIKGLVRRPAYATSGSQSTQATSSSGAFDPPIGVPLDTVTTDDGTVVEVTLNAAGGGVFTLDVSTNAAGCVCSIIGFGSAEIEPDTGPTALGALMAGSIVFTLQAGATPDIVFWDNVMIECV